MDNFKAIYQILKYLETSLDGEYFDENEVCHERLGLTYARWESLLIMMQDEGFIKGLTFTQTMTDKFPHLVRPVRPRITIKGLEYLAENTMMKKAANILKGIKETVPGL